MTAKLLTRLKDRRDDAKMDCDRFAAKFAESPAYAMEWSDDAFKAAAKLDVLTEVINAIEAGIELDAIVRELTQRVMSAAKCPKMSTSVPANLMATYAASATANLLDTIQHWN